ncbi:PRA1 family protein B2-like [Brassica rapa]|uniref:PRA1 family protein B2-like n=1 Tax=Brassica campestris TaxID=3711 RepID=UPI0004F1692C|nr:PRA1 family protein B2-like [Brassica rapa]XP_009102417.1 PRA1 family protein B2-like [Brassica rapa]XP_009116182.1 PRA1 family protein B2-like [Brassica rapa]XP_009150811.1 PRA1 family protein B2-like [Brassica rapa]
MTSSPTTQSSSPSSLPSPMRQARLRPPARSRPPLDPPLRWSLSCRLKLSFRRNRQNHWIVGFSLVTHPFSLVFLLCLLCLLASWLFLYLFRPSVQPIVVLSRAFSDRETLGCLILFG